MHAGQPTPPPPHNWHHPARRGLVSALAAVLLLGGIGADVAAADPGTDSPSPVPLGQADAPTPAFGPNVTVFDPSMPTSEIAATANAIHATQVNNEMGTERYSLLFLPGEYGTAEEPLQIKVGYYTEVAGLGANPGDVTINGKVEVYNRCFDEDGEPTDGTGECFALNNFWRGMSNLTINVNAAGQDGCRGGNNFWAVSQAVSLRRVDVVGGGLTLMDYCTGPSFASGGYLADSRAGTVVNGSQQQWFTRNSEVTEWSNGVWNQVFAGVDGAPDDAAFPDPPYTTLETTPISREKPWLFVDAQGDYQVRVPSAHRDTSGITWGDGMTPGRTVPLTDFHIAHPGDSVQTINAGLAAGKHLLLTPGVYDVDRSILVNNADTVVLGMGLATLTAVNGSTPLRIADRSGIIVAGLTIDAGTIESSVLLQVGARKGNSRVSADNPLTLNDVYFRVGGPHVGKTDIALEVNSDNVLIDHTWVWRADHGVEDFDLTDGFLGDNERWATNIGRNGVVVNGDDVTATGLFVEHFQEYNTIWNGERGRVVLYQNELPYDPPEQSDWTAPDGTLGWAAYKVGDGVKEHHLWGGGVYVFNRNNPDITTENGYEVPQTPGVVLEHVMTKNLSGPGTINAVVNGVGDKVDGIPDPGGSSADYEDPSYVIEYSTPAPTPSPTPTVTVTATIAPTPSTSVPTTPVDVYSTPGFHNVNGRQWYTACEPYSQTIRCRTDIWSTQVRYVSGRFASKTGWHFNNLTYLPFMTRAQWATNPLGHTTSWTSPEGRQWRTECDTAVTGRGGCRSYIWTQSVVATPKAGGGHGYAQQWGWVFNNIVRFTN